MANTVDLITPNWPVPTHVVAACSMKTGGQSQAPYSSANMALHVGDDPQLVEANRAQLQRQLGLRRVSWLDQVHGTDVVPASEQLQTADAVYSNNKDIACAVMTADCLPLLLCDLNGTEVAALHCGWRGLASGLVEKTLAKMTSGNHDLMAWMGPAIGPSAFEVGQDVVHAFALQPWFAPHCFMPAGEGKYLADIYGLCRAALAASGVTAVYGGNHCTVSETDRFYSFRRDGVTGRMASVIAII